MRIVILCSSPYSENASAVAVRMAKLGHIPVGALSLPALDHGTLRRKLGQWGVRGVASYARTKLIPYRRDQQVGVNNPYLRPLLQHHDTFFRNMREVAASFNFPVEIFSDQNAPDSIEQLQAWAPDLVIFTGGNILRRQLLEVPRLGVINLHLGLLPEIRGMSSPEWSLLNHVPVGVTIHYMDSGIDTGPILLRGEFPGASKCESLSDLRNRLIAFGIEKLAETVAGLDRGTIAATPQPDIDRFDFDENRQFFVMHEWLVAQSAGRLAKSHSAAAAKTVDG
jgi:folate-dependent phosphoribosylglycinamide formyltransferase PurN